MRGHVSSELEVRVPAKDIWAVYSSPELPSLIVQLTPDLYDKIDIVEGDGGVGTVLHIVLAPGMPEPRTWQEKFMVIDNNQRLKVVRQVKGGYLDMGFHMYEDIFKIIEKDATSCIIRSTTNFEVDEEFQANASLVSPDSLKGMANAIAKYVIQKRAQC